jgi:hypothetical protein
VLHHRALVSAAAISLLATVAACAASAPDRTPSVPEPGGPPAPEGRRTTVEFGPGPFMVAEVLEVGADARATVRTPAGTLSEEIRKGDDLYLRMHHADAVLRTGGWIHTDVDGAGHGRRHGVEPAFPVALTDLADLGDLDVGDRVAGQVVADVHRPREGVVSFDLGRGRTLRLTEHVVEDPAPIAAPDRSEIVSLPELVTPRS